MHPRGRRDVLATWSGAGARALRLPRRPADLGVSCGVLRVLSALPRSGDGQSRAPPASCGGTGRAAKQPRDMNEGTWHGM